MSGGGAKGMALDPYAGVEETARLVRAREASAVEVARATLERVSRLDTRLAAFFAVTADMALAMAEDVDRAVARGAAPPLAGVTIGVKDLFDVAGLRTTAGSRIVDRAPAEDATVVAKMRAAGAVFVGKTSMHELAYGVTNQHPVFGPARNPWDTSRITGGSSGGSAAAAAAGLCHAALGSDTGGSVRIPASLCGVVGLKPTYGRVSLAGAVALGWSLDHAGPLARSVRDAAIVYLLMAGYDAQDPASVRIEVEDPLPRIEDGVRGLRIGIPHGHFFERAEPEVRALVLDAVAVLEREGATAQECSFPGREHLFDTQRKTLSAEAAALHAEALAERASEIAPDVLERLVGGQKVTGPEYALAQRRRAELRRDVALLFERFDVLAMPATPVPAPGIDTSAVAEAPRLTALTSPFNLTGLPAISVPCGFAAGGLPVGLQLVAPAWQEAALLRVARAYERAAGWSDRHPALDAYSSAASAAASTA